MTVLVVVIMAMVMRVRDGCMAVSMGMLGFTARVLMLMMVIMRMFMGMGHRLIGMAMIMTCHSRPPHK